MRNVRRVLVFVLASTLATSSVDAQPKKDKGGGAASALPVDVETAEALYAKLDYEQSNGVAEKVVKQQRGLSHDQLVRAYRVLAVTYAILDKEEQARDAFLQLLVYEPEYTADSNLGPKVTTPFVEARGIFRSYAAKPGLDVAVNVRADGGQLRVTTRDPTHIVKKVNVGHRWTSSGEYAVTQVSVGDGVPVEIAAAPQGRTRLDFYAQAVDERDNAVFEAGSAQVPKSAFVEAGSRRGGGGKEGGKEGGGVLSSPVFWIIAGAAIVGGGAAAFFFLRPEDPPTKAALSPVIVCGGDGRCR
jgi:hypothetical protein